MWASHADQHLHMTIVPSSAIEATCGTPQRAAGPRQSQLTAYAIQHLYQCRLGSSALWQASSSVVVLLYFCRSRGLGFSKTWGFIRLGRYGRRHLSSFCCLFGRLRKRSMAGADYPEIIVRPRLYRYALFLAMQAAREVCSVLTANFSASFVVDTIFNAVIPERSHDQNYWLNHA